ncbi:MAG: YaiO family outer membrane beta-barrel protein, partial [Candidatus Rokuibacteriota bacterium]
ARLRLWQGDEAAARDLFAEALGLFSRRLEAHPDDVDARTGRAGVLARLERHADALADYDRAVAAAPADAESWVGRGRVLSRLGRLAEAEGDFRRAVGLDPRSAEAQTALGDVLSRQQRFAEAVAAYEQARRLAPESAEPMLGLARLRLWQEDVAGARAGYEAVLRLDPRNADALEGLARIAAIPPERRLRLDLGGRYEALTKGRSDWYEASGRVTVRAAKRTRLFAGVDQFHRNDADDTQLVLGGAQNVPGDVTLSGAVALGLDAEVVARQIYEVEVGYRLARWATPLLAYRRSNFPGGVHADVVTPGVELTWRSFLSILARYYYTHASDAGGSHAGAGRVTFFPEARVSPHLGVAYGRETFLAGTVEEVVRGVNVLTLSAGVLWRLTDATGVRVDYAYEGRQGSYAKHGVGVGVFYLF